MAVKKIIDIEVQDAAFERFLAKYHEFEKKLEAMPDEWRKVDEAMGDAGGAFAQNGQKSGALLAGMAANAAVISEAIHSGAKAQRAFEGATHRAHRAMMNLNTAARGVASTVANVAKTLVGIGIGGAAGVWGLENLANTALSRQRAAMGSGMSSGQASAFTTYFGQFGNAAGVASNIAAARNDVSKRWAFSGLGISQGDLANKSNFDLALEAERKAQAMVKSMPEGSWASIAQARGLTNFFDMDTLRVLRGTPTGSVNAAIAGARSDVGSLGFSADVAKQWTDFSISMHRAGIEIQSSLITGLHKLAPQLTTISHQISDWIAAFLNSPQAQKIMDAVVSGLQVFADYIASPKFKSDMHDFAVGVGQIGSAIMSALRYFNLLPGVGISAANVPFEKLAADQTTRKPLGYLDNLMISDSINMRKGKGEYSPGNIHADVVAAAQKFNLPVDLLDRLVMTESGYGVNLKSPAGAIGPAQLMPGTASDMGVQNIADPAQNIMGGAAYLRRMIDHFGGDVVKGVAAYNAGPGGIHPEKYGSSWLMMAPNETQKYVAKILGSGRAQTDAQVRAMIGSGKTGDPFVDNLKKVVTGLASKAASSTITINNNTAAQVAIQANAATR